ncbi:MAG: hypothetical protein A2898_03420 [Candidatus Kerfeldbacteria bacterium RIFCSPLOWO2_01_FULL_48_11]|uniref:Uncharacterized protein n=1 Tax=Candidatus Kerfeldbacteria bacterium RIFCSPLOWO2_01_FULL_48_11 TaxID=1798543 RepID=A0A1G2B295_9BACT|nr:MAG: hypothetical protein A2898_03420 [Candidatus Kerfeldbacteria bacterium RIFCSPLOWO2_01_FULL_48_11]
MNSLIRPQTLHAFDFLGDVLGTQTVEGQQSSNFTEIAIYRNGGETHPVIVKCLLPVEIAALEGKQRFSRAQELVNMMGEFHTLLQQHEVVLAEPHKLYVSENGWPIYEATHYGDDYRVRIIRSPANAQTMIREILRCSSGVLHQSHPLTVGMDLRLSNFAKSPDGPVYVDTFPPLYSPDGGTTYHVHIPIPPTQAEVDAHIARKFNPCGSLRRLRFDLLSIDPELERLLMSEIRVGLQPDLHRTVVDFFQSIDRGGITTDTSIGDVVRAIEQTPPSDVDTLREICARWIPMGPDRIIRMDQVFYLARNAGPGDPRTPADPAERIAKLIDLLRGIAAD